MNTHAFNREEDSFQRLPETVYASFFLRLSCPPYASKLIRINPKILHQTAYQLTQINCLLNPFGVFMLHLQH